MTTIAILNDKLNNTFKNKLLRKSIEELYSKSIEELSISLTGQIYQIDHMELAKIYGNLSCLYLNDRDIVNAKKNAEFTIAAAPDWYRGYHRLAKVYEFELDYENMCSQYEQMMQCYRNTVYKNYIVQNNLLVNSNQDNMALSDMTLTYIQDYYNRDVNYLHQWIIQNGGFINKINIKYYDIDYRGTTVSSSVKKGETLISVPFKCIISLSDCKKENPYNIRLIQNNINIEAIHSYLALELLKIREDKSFKYPYIRCLPKYYNNVPINFTAEEIMELQGSYAVVKIMQKIYMLQREYSIIKNALPDLPYSFDDFIWARTAIITRVYAAIRNGEQDTFAVPFADMANHTIPPNTKWFYDEKYELFKVSAENMLSKGDVLYETYGYKSNYRYFVNYGFTVDNNKSEEILICFNLQINVLLKQYIKAVLNQQLELNNTDNTNNTDNSQKPPLSSILFKNLLNDKFNNLIHATIIDKAQFSVGYIYNKNVNDMFQYLRDLCLDKYDKTQGQPDLLKVEVEMLNVLKYFIENMLESFITTIEDDQLLLNKNTLSLTFNMRNCIVMRKEEKKVLKFYLQLIHDALDVINIPAQNLKKKITKLRKKYNITYIPNTQNFMKYFELLEMLKNQKI